MQVLMKGQEHRQTGFSLIEVIIVLAVLVTLIALLVPSTVQQLTAGWRNSTLDEMDELKLAMIGDPDLKSRGVRSDFGFLGDMGNLPVGALPSDLDELVVQGAQPAYSFDSGKRAGAGWKGPYITLGAGSDPASHRQDAFGNDYTYDDADYTNPQGQAVDGKLVTLGADGVAGGTGVDEDVTLEVLKAETTATVNGYIFDAGSNPLGNAEVKIHFSSSGALTSSSTTTDSTGFYQFTDIPFGNRSLEIGSTTRLDLVAGSPVATVENLSFQVENNTASAITVASLQADYSVAAFYNFIKFGGVEVYKCSDVGPPPSGTGDIVSFSASKTVAASPSPSPPVIRGVQVASASTQAADVTLTVVGGGTTALVELLKFQDDGAACENGNAVDVANVTFTITLRDPSNTIVGQFSFTVP